MSAWANGVVGRIGRDVFSPCGADAATALASTRALQPINAGLLMSAALGILFFAGTLAGNPGSMCVRGVCVLGLFGDAVCR